MIKYEDIKTYCMYKTWPGETYVFMLSKNDENFTYYIYDNSTTIRAWYKKNTGDVLDWEHTSYIWSDMIEAGNVPHIEMVKSLFEKGLMK